MKQRIFISSAIDEEKLPFITAEEMKFGRAHYSWKIVTALYSQGLEEAGLETKKVIRPEIYQTKIAQNTFGLRHDDIHLAVKPIEHIRSFYGIKNIFICGWEFPEFSDKAYESNPFFNHIAVLKHADKIWCWSDFTTSNLKSYGINTAITMPPPVIVTKPSDEKSISTIPTLALNTTRIPTPNDIRAFGDVLRAYKDSVIFISVLNPFDKRKQIKLMLTAFQAALKRTPNLVLIVKLVIDNINTTLGNIQEILEIHHDFKGQSDRIVFVSETLTDSQMIKLMKTAKFYFCTSSTEGLNLPMIEAMSLGVVPVSSRATAMADYIHEENAIVIKNDKLLTDGAYHFLHNHMPTTHFPPNLKSSIDALISAANLTKNRYNAISSRAKKDVHEKYSMQGFIDRVNSGGAL